MKIENSQRYFYFIKKNLNSTEHFVIFYLYGRIVFMANIGADIEILKKEISKTENDLVHLYIDLGRVAFPWNKAINYVPSENTYNQLKNTYDKYIDISDKVEKVSIAYEKLSNGDRQIGKVQRSMKDLDNSFQTLLSSLGAIAVESRNAGTLPEKLVHFLKPMDLFIEKERRLIEKIESGNLSPIVQMILTSKIQKMKRKRVDVYLEVGKKIYGSGDFRKVPGERAQIILMQMDEIRLLKKNYKKDIKDRQKEIYQAQNSLQDIGAKGEEARKLKMLQSEKKEIEKELENCLKKYGEVLAQGMDQWIDEQAPQELKDSYNNIKRCNIRLKGQNLNVKHYSLEQEIGVSENKIVQLSSQVNYLNSQISALKRQKTEIQAKIEDENQVISVNREKQQQIIIEAKMLSKGKI